MDCQTSTQRQRPIARKVPEEQDLTVVRKTAAACNPAARKVVIRKPCPGLRVQILAGHEMVKADSQHVSALTEPIFPRLHQLIRREVHRIMVWMDGIVDKMKSRIGICLRAGIPHHIRFFPWVVAKLFEKLEPVPVGQSARIKDGDGRLPRKIFGDGKHLPKVHFHTKILLGELLLFGYPEREEVGVGGADRHNFWFNQGYAFHGVSFLSMSYAGVFKFRNLH